MADTYNSTGVLNQSDPAIGVVALTGSAQTFSKRVRGVYIDTDGSLVCTMADGTSATFANLKAGCVYPFCIVAITGSGTTGYALV